MTLPPLWKVRRELASFVRQLPTSLKRLTTWLFATRFYDLTLARKIRRFDGKLPEAQRVAIYLIFPDHGLLASHLMALEYLANTGYATKVVSNLPLSDADRSILLDHCWTYLERPNYGYDFGGYRDGILDLAAKLGTLERLVILNDSCWFPLPGSRDWLDDVEALNVDFAAATSHYGTPRVDAADFASIRWGYTLKHRNFHYGSFALCLREKVLRHPDFLTYWRKLALTNAKKAIVRRGETGFTLWALRRNLSTACTLDIARLDRDLARLDQARLMQVAQEMVTPDKPGLRELRQRLLSGSPTREQILALILTMVSAQGASYALAGYATRALGFPFLKKSPVWHNKEDSDTTLALIARLEGPTGRLIEAEARDLRARRAPGFDADK